MKQTSLLDDPTSEDDPKRSSVGDHSGADGPRSNYTPSRPLSDGLAVPLKHRLRRLSGLVEALTGREHARSVLHGPFA